MNLAPLRSSLVRVLEPEAMDTLEEARDYDAMDHGDVNRAFVADLLAAQRCAQLAPDVEFLDLGTGTAQIPIELCAQNRRARVVAIDLAAPMLRLAAENIARRGLGGQITLQRVDAKRLPFADGHFAAVMSNSIVHHIPEPCDVLAEMLRVLRAGGVLFVPVLWVSLVALVVLLATSAGFRALALAHFDRGTVDLTIAAR